MSRSPRLSGKASRVAVALALAPALGVSAFPFATTAAAEIARGARQDGPQGLTQGEIIARLPRLRLGQEVSANFGGGQVMMGLGGGYADAWAFEGRAGQRVRIEARSDAFDTVLGVSDTVIFVEHESDDAPGLGTDSALNLELEDKTYIVFVRSYAEGDSGPYTLSVRNAPAAPVRARARAQALTVGQPAQGTIGPDDPLDGDSDRAHDIWSFDGRAGQSVRIEVGSTDFDTYAVLELNEAEIAANDDAPGGTDSVIEHVLPRDGRYEIKVRPYTEDGAGDYTIRVSVGQTPDSSTADEAVQGRIGASGEGGSHSLRGQAGERFAVSLSAPGVRPAVQVIGPSGMRWNGGVETRRTVNPETGAWQEVHGDRAVTMLTLPETGAYQIQARRDIGDRSGQGPYELRIERLGPDAACPAMGGLPQLRYASGGTIDVDQAVCGAIAPGDTVRDGRTVDLYQLTLPVGKRVNVSLEPLSTTQWTPAGEIQGPNGARLSLRASTLSGNDFTATSSGVHTVAVFTDAGSSSTSIGDYVLRVETSPW